jgi:hypothetical protein
MVDPSERRIVRIVGGGVAWKGTTVWFAIFVAQVRTVMGPDQVAEILEQFDHRESLLGRPVSGNGEGDCQEQSS